MGNTTSIKQSIINYEDIPTAEAVMMNIPVATAYSIDVKMPSAPPMPSNELSTPTKFIQDKNTFLGKCAPEPSAPPLPSNELSARTKFMQDKNKLLGKYAPEPSAPPMPTNNLPLRNQYKIYSDSISEIERGTHKNYFEDSYERGLREGIDRCYVALVRDFLKSGKLDNLEILTRELDYVNERINARKCNKRRTQIKDLIEERLKIVLR